MLSFFPMVALEIRGIKSANRVNEWWAAVFRF